MTIEQFTQENIDKVAVTPVLNGALYKINAKEGYCILIPENVSVDEDGNVRRTYKYTVALRANYDWSTIQVVTTDSVGENDTIAGVTPPNKIA